MELSRVADYAVRAVLYLSVCDDLCRTQDISEAMMVPRAYLSKVLQDLSRRDIVRLKPGVGGGVVLAVDPSDLSLLDVINAVEGRMAFNRCTYAPGECQFTDCCPVHAFWATLQSTIEERVGGVTFADLAADCSLESFEEEKMHACESSGCGVPVEGEPCPR